MVQAAQCHLVGGGTKWKIPGGMVERKPAYVLGNFHDSMQGAPTAY